LYTVYATSMSCATILYELCELNVFHVFIVIIAEASLIISTYIAGTVTNHLKHISIVQM